MFTEGSSLTSLPVTVPSSPRPGRWPLGMVVEARTGAPEPPPPADGRLVLV